MSLHVLIGSDIEDVSRIVDTVAALEYLKETLPQKQSIIDLAGGQFNSEKLETLIDWYNSMKNVILYAGNNEDVVLEPDLV
jgi:diaminopimelate decarboxylase